MIITYMTYSHSYDSVACKHFLRWLKIIPVLNMVGVSFCFLVFEINALFFFFFSFKIKAKLKKLYDMQKLRGKCLCQLLGVKL